MANQIVDVEVLFGHVQNPQSYLELDITSDNNIRSKIQSDSGLIPEAKYTIIRVSTDISMEILDQYLGMALGAAPSQLLSSGSAQETIQGGTRFLKLPLPAFSEEYTQFFEGKEGFQFELNVKAESDSTGIDLANFKQQNKAAVYALSKSLRFSAKSPRLCDRSTYRHELDQILAPFAGVFPFEIAEFASIGLSSFGLDVKVEFDSFEDLPDGVREKYSGFSGSIFDKNITQGKEFIPIFNQQFEVYVFLNNAHFIRFGGHVPHGDQLHAALN